MPSRRLLKAAEAIREVVGMAILTDISDPRVSGVTVLGVEVAADMRQAKVFVTIMGNETKQNLCLHGLQSAAGFLQSKVAKRIDTRYTPKLLFVNDLGVKKSIEISQILGRVLNEEGKAGDAAKPGVASQPVTDEQNTNGPHELIDDASELMDDIGSETATSIDVEDNDSADDANPTDKDRHIRPGGDTEASSGDHV